MNGSEVRGLQSHFKTAKNGHFLIAYNGGLYLFLYTSSDRTKYIFRILKIQAFQVYFDFICIHYSKKVIRV